MELALKVREVPSGIKMEIQGLDKEIHELAHRIEEALMHGKGYLTNRLIELEKLEEELMAKMRDFVWAVRRLDKVTRLLDLPSNK